ncbi:MAG: ribonuclease R [Flavobacteriales bacterium]|nr:ribonuclease R [Flavobacteriales bacterium]
MTRHKNPSNKSDKVSITKINRVFNKYPKKSFNYKQISRRIGADNEAQKKLVALALTEMCNKKILKEVRPGNFQLIRTPEDTQSFAVKGTVDMTTSGSAFVIVEGSETDIYISSKNTLTALHQDLVKVKVAKRPKHNFSRGRKKPDSRLEGEIISILERKRTEFVGTLNISKEFAFLIPDSPRMNVDIFVPLKKLKGGKNGEKVLVKMLDWPDTAASPFGEVVQVLGAAGDNNTEMVSILAEHALPSSFPQSLEAEAAKIPTEITDKIVAERKDYRAVTTFTIDPVDAKDFDDALSIQKTKSGNWEIGVHIADVSHYVKRGSVIDIEAFERATSIYLVDRVIPMLPEMLSNQVCSLRPDEDKLSFATIFEINDEGTVLKKWFGRTVIRSNMRFTYAQAQELIEDKTDDRPLSKEIKKLDQLAKMLRKERFTEGSIKFERTEVTFELDEEGHPLAVIPKVMRDSNKLIEEFMLLANKLVSEKIGKAIEGEKRKVRPFVYRIHDSPDKEKLVLFAKFIATFGYSFKIGTPREIAHSINGVLLAVKGKPEQNVIETLAIRTMAKAEYSTKNIGHYGLGFQHYSHFTSPIRRYPDLIVHRLLEHYLEGKPVDQKELNELESACEHCSEQERAAERAERESIKFKQVQFMVNQVGNEYGGIISGIAEFGIFIELEDNKCEGLVRASDLDGDHYRFDKYNYCFKGQQRGKKYTLGDKVTVVINSVDIIKKQINMLLV